MSFLWRSMNLKEGAKAVCCYPGGGWGCTPCKRVKCTQCFACGEGKSSLQSLVWQPVCSNLQLAFDGINAPRTVDGHAVDVQRCRERWIYSIYCFTDSNEALHFHCPDDAGTKHLWNKSTWMRLHNAISQKDVIFNWLLVFKNSARRDFLALASNG
jgi:hypothetical protein